MLKQKIKYFFKTSAIQRQFDKKRYAALKNIMRNWTTRFMTHGKILVSISLNLQICKCSGAGV